MSVVHGSIVDDSVAADSARPSGHSRSELVAAASPTGRGSVPAAMATLALIAVVGLILLGAVRIVGNTGIPTAPIDPAAVDLEGPPGLHVAATAVGERGNTIDDAVGRRLAGLTPVPGSAVHLAYFQTTTAASTATSDIYAWDHIDPVDGRLRCLGWIEAGGDGGAACEPSDGPTGPSPYWSMSDGSAGTSYSVLIGSLPADAAEAVAVTATGRTVGTSVVSETAFLSWPDHEGSTGGILPDGNREFGPPLALFILDRGGRHMDRFDYTP